MIIIIIVIIINIIIIAGPKPAYGLQALAGGIMVPVKAGTIWVVLKVSLSSDWIFSQGIPTDLPEEVKIFRYPLGLMYHPSHHYCHHRCLQSIIITNKETFTGIAANNRLLSPRLIILHFAKIMAFWT